MKNPYQASLSNSDILFQIFSLYKHKLITLVDLIDSNDNAQYSCKNDISKAQEKFMFLFDLSQPGADKVFDVVNLLFFNTNAFMLKNDTKSLLSIVDMIDSQFKV
jgi:hypothetical protein